MRFLSPVYRPRESWRARFAADLREQGLGDEDLCFELREVPGDAPPHPCPWIDVPQAGLIEWEPAVWLKPDEYARVSHVVAYEAGGTVRCLETHRTRDAISHQHFPASQVLSRYGFEDGAAFPPWAKPSLERHASLAIAEAFEGRNMCIALAPGPGATDHNPFRVSAAAMRDPDVAGGWGERVDVYESSRALLDGLRLPLWAADAGLFNDSWDLFAFPY